MYGNDESGQLESTARMREDTLRILLVYRRNQYDRICKKRER